LSRRSFQARVERDLHRRPQAARIGTHAPRPARKCTRYRRAGATLRRVGVAGANAVPFSGRIGRRALRLGRHRLTVQATDAAGNDSARRTKRFRIVPRRGRR
ncbi:MAG TPA: hypothetical protein VHG69_11735, partial [Thermoleophilaceae bacterium]|nr:hypothetical protein [Thermoleophilaceae bacterium]